ncbi:g_PROTEIN_RECEP_F1_2 domain-containing protein [Trichonephila clavata]|uniref:G_PROTEIN_RECEP_F1_2 domain-containing protein n=1 Tax=Trichonephila clavata TaxID=2740835 RepID=A0A8X6L8A5_TRICU|nr:g_PROTEIN_RECEP_F1_2 domain-containing protein [Trichonephila clavata]
MDTTADVDFGRGRVTCLTASVLTQTVISSDRFIAIIFPLHARITKQRTSVVITSIWMTSGLVSVPFLFTRKYRTFQWRNLLEFSCVEEWPYEEQWNAETGICLRTFPLQQLYYTFVTMTLFFVPVAIMIVTYMLIICRLWRTRAPGEANIVNINIQHRVKMKKFKECYFDHVKISFDIPTSDSEYFSEYDK